MRRLLILSAILALAGCASAAPPPAAAPVAGEAVITYSRPGASLRDKEGRDTQRVTVWYPAADGAVATARLIGPPGAPYFISGAAADDAPLAPGPRLPLIVMSHGFGASARQMAWLGIALAESGYMVAAVDHPGNNGTDDRTPTGALLWWERADDLRHALDAVLADPRWAGRIDPGRIGAVGYSMGGASVLVELGARPDPARLAAFCAGRPADGLCGPTIRDGDFGEAGRAAVLASSPAVAASVAGQGRDRRDPRLKAALLIAPALGPALDPASLARITVPVHILTGTEDTVVDPALNARAFAEALPNDSSSELAGVGHNDFLGLCGAAGRARYAPLCAERTPRAETHAAAVVLALIFFESALR